MEEQKPGQTISPHTDKPKQDQYIDNSTSEPESSQWKFNPENVLAETPELATKHKSTFEPVTWSASEFIAHKKSAGWYLALTVAAVILAAIIFLLTHDKISTGVILFAALVLGVFGARKPRVLDYKLDDGGLNIGQKFYSYDLFKSFAVMEEGAFSSIILLPLKRFMPSLSIYYAPQDEGKITDILADRLPFEDRKRDAVDSFMHRIRF